MPDALIIDPGERLDYEADWSDFLGEDAIDTSTWSITPAGPVLEDAGGSGNTHFVFISGCTLGVVYRLTNRIVTEQGRTAERAYALRCESR